MTRTKIAIIISLLTFFACGQNKTFKRSVQLMQDSVTTQQPIFDTTKITILPIDPTYHSVFKDAAPLQLTSQDLHSIDTLLNDCIKAHNNKQDSTNEYSEVIDLKKYRRQYVPFVDSKGNKKVYVNCFCSHNDVPGEFDYWKKTLIVVNDGGSCFFQITLNLTTNKYEQLYLNGYA
jgi:hypothetical protein